MLVTPHIGTELDLGTSWCKEVLSVADKSYGVIDVR